MAAAASPPSSTPQFLALHGAQLSSIGFPSELIPALQRKLQQDTFDAGSAFQIEDEDGQRSVVATRALAADGDVFLIDHAFSFSVENHRRLLLETPGLLERLAAMMGLSEPDEEEEEEEGDAAEAPTDDEDGQEQQGADAPWDEEDLSMLHPDRRKPLYDQACEQIWRYAAPYRLADPSDPITRFKTVWFVNDEFGSAFRHGPRSQANFRVSPFIYLPNGTLRGAVAYSLAWPIRAVEEGDECRRDYALGLPPNTLPRACRLAIWFAPPPAVRRRMAAAHAAKFQQLERIEAAATASSSSLPPPAPLDGHFSRTLGARAGRRRIRIYSDNAQISENLTRPEFEHVGSPAEADVVWIYHTTMSAAYRQEQGLGEEVVLNQTVGDECLVFKHLLPLTAARVPGAARWLPLAFNMEEEAAAFIHEYLARPRLFISKPWNLGRSMDSAVVDSLPQALRLAETSPKVNCDYVKDTALVYGKKIDVRYRLMVRSWHPLELIRWTHWGLRIANKSYSLETKDLNDFETHFTVMDYAGYVQTKVDEADYMAAFERENGVPFAVVDRQADAILKALFEAAVPVLLERAGGDPAALQNVASFYGADFMFARVEEEGSEGGGGQVSFTPKLLEVTFAPDAAAAVKEFPDFYNHAFGVLLLNEEHSDFRML